MGINIACYTIHLQKIVHPFSLRPSLSLSLSLNLLRIQGAINSNLLSDKVDRTHCRDYFMSSSSSEFVRWSFIILVFLSGHLTNPYLPMLGNYFPSYDNIWPCVHFYINWKIYSFSSFPLIAMWGRQP